MSDPKHETIAMLFPMNLEYPKEEFLIIKNNLEFIRSLGIEIDEFGDSSFVIKSHPTWFKEGLEELFVIIFSKTFLFINIKKNKTIIKVKHA